MLYLLPTSKPSGYRGKYPHRVISASYGGAYKNDADGRPCVHLETNDGRRFTASRYVIEDHYAFGAGFVDADISDIVKEGIVATPLPQERYDEWLQRIRAARLLKSPLHRTALGVI